eukprot:105435-Rhodomonas_salina.1
MVQREAGGTERGCVARLQAAGGGGEDRQEAGAALAPQDRTHPRRSPRAHHEAQRGLPRRPR